jgi:TRAP-type C4-dicarboxylate transport system permease small subunit
MTMTAFFSGMIAMGFLIAALFFFRFWWRTRDSLFAAFALAFLLFACNQALITGIETSRDEKSLVYLLRLAGFALIIFAVVQKNWRSKRTPHGPA